MSESPQAASTEVPLPDGLHGEELPRIDAPDRRTFEREYLRRSRPVILRGVTEGWRPPESWTLDYMARTYGDARVITAALHNGALFDDDATGVVFRRVVLGDFIASLARPEAAADYVMAPTWNFPDTLARDYRVPAYCEGAAHMRAKVWVGKAGTVTPMHRDVPHNLNVHLTGRKRWMLFPPGSTRRLYSRGLFSGMPNFARVDPERPDYAAFPRFRGTTALVGTVGPGETLFIPHGWWHHTRTLSDAVAMNFWWGGSAVYLAALASTAFKRLRGIRQDEWGK